MDRNGGRTPFKTVGADAAPPGHAPSPSHGAHDPHAGHAHGGIRSIGAFGGHNRRLLVFVMIFGLGVTAIEVVAGLLANSLVLLADAAHYLTDLLGLLLAFAAISFALRPANLRKSFGYQRAEVIGAFLNAILLWGLSGYLAYESYRRILAPPEVEGPIVAVVGAFTLVGNVVMAGVLHRASGENLNMRAAYLHIISDALGSAAALAAGLLVTFGGFHLADPLLTLFVTFLIIGFTWRLTRQTLHILLEGTPERIDTAAIVNSLRAIGNVKDVHDLHVWSLTSGVESMSVHVVIEVAPADERLVAEVHRKLLEEFGLQHVTVQIEGPGPCPSTPCPPFD